MNYRLIRSAMVLLAIGIALLPQIASAGLITGVTATSNFWSSIGMPWLDTFFTNGIKFVFGPGLAIGGGIALLTGVNRLRHQQEKGEWLHQGVPVLLTVGTAAGGVGLYNWAYAQSAKASGLMLAHTLLHHHLH